LSVVVGIPGLWSAQAGVGYSFGSSDFSVYAGATVATVTGYASWSSTSGFNVGWSAGLTPFGGFPVSSNFFSVGVNYNLSGYGTSMNISAWTFSENGTSFNPSFSAMVFSEHATNLVRGGGFRSNNGVLKHFTSEGDYPGALEYFGLVGEAYDGDAASHFYINKEDPSIFGIRYNKNDFSSYSRLMDVYNKESFSYYRYKENGYKGLELADTEVFNGAMQPEERLGLINQYNNRRYLSPFYNGYYLRKIRGLESTIYQNNMDYYNTPYNYSPFSPTWINQFFNWIPRKW